MIDINLISMSKKLDAVLGEKKEEPKEEPKEEKKEEPKADGCGDGDKPAETPKVEDSAPSSLPQYTQSLGTIEKGYSLDEAFARLYGGK